MTFEQAIETLFRAAHGSFVDERKRLAVELRTAGDKAGAAKLNKMTRPPASAWAVNQLWWRSRAEFQALLDAAKRVREGAMDALPQHKAAVSALSKLAAEYLKEIGNVAGDATLRRVETSLAAIAAGGGFDPELPGALTEDREPSGFLSLGIATGGAATCSVSASCRARADERGCGKRVPRRAEGEGCRGRSRSQAGRD
ncbi:MAG: hypothetical protein JNM17_02620 [Archangium sp.]|nr:hypothetical protein [Archangium sp.]